MEKVQNIDIHFGAMADPIADQLKQQGFKFDKTVVQSFQNSLDSLNYVRIHGFLTDSQANKCFDKLYKQVLRHVLSLNGLKEVKGK